MNSYEEGAAKQNLSAVAQTLDRDPVIKKRKLKKSFKEFL